MPHEGSVMWKVFPCHDVMTLPKLYHVFNTTPPNQPSSLLGYDCQGKRWEIYVNDSQSSRCACLLDSGGTIWLLWVYRDPVGIKIDSVGTSTRKWPVPTLYRLMYLHILMSMRLKGGKLLPPSSEDNTCVARKCIPYFFGIYFEYLCACTKLRVW